LGTRWFQEKTWTPTSKLKGVINKDLKKIGIGWDEVQEAAEDRRSWWIRVASPNASSTPGEPGTIKFIQHDKLDSNIYISIHT